MRHAAPQILRQGDGNRQWQVLETLGEHLDVVQDVSWAPTIGRTYHLIATACRDGRVRIFRLTDSVAQDRFTIEKLAELSDHEEPVRAAVQRTGAGPQRAGRVLTWVSGERARCVCKARRCGASSGMSPAPCCRPAATTAKCACGKVRSRAR